MRGSIPAWAGETLGVCGGYVGGEVYPRVGGGNTLRLRITSRLCGLSPRGRGKPTSTTTASPCARSIPAWAGETPDYAIRHLRPTVYPRVGGGNVHEAVVNAAVRGLSPRGRGKPAQVARRPARPRSIPAWAGETGWSSLIASIQGVYPRVGGGNCRAYSLSAIGRGLSPRGRGKPVVVDVVSDAGGSIPAWAGET